MSRVLHPVLTPDERRSLVRNGVERFNRGEFFEAHEIWEEVWRSNLPEPRTLFQGLIQVAAALHMILDLHRTIGPRRTFAKARAHLETYAPVALGLDLDGVLDSVGRWQSWLETPDEERRPAVPEIRVLDQDAVG